MEIFRINIKGIDSNGNEIKNMGDYSDNFSL